VVSLYFPGQELFIMGDKGVAPPTFTDLFATHYVTPAKSMLAAMQENARTADPLAGFSGFVDTILATPAVTWEDEELGETAFAEVVLASMEKMLTRMFHPYCGTTIKQACLKLGEDPKKPWADVESPKKLVAAWLCNSLLEAGAADTFNSAWDALDSEGTGSLLSSSVEAIKFCDDIIDAIQLLLKKLLPALTVHAVALANIVFKRTSALLDDDRLYELLGKMILIGNSIDERKVIPSEQELGKDAIEKRMFQNPEGKTAFKTEVKTAFGKVEAPLLAATTHFQKATDAFLSFVNDKADTLIPKLKPLFRQRVLTVRAPVSFACALRS
jgi:hypothetical protein